MDESLNGHLIEGIYEPSEWECYLFGMGAEGLVVSPSKNAKIPNRFWRWMQYLFFGNRWVKKGK